MRDARRLPASGFWVSPRGYYECLVPIVSLFFGIVIRMYHDEHPPPHFHAAYQGFEAFVRIEDGEIVHGALPPRPPASSVSGRWTIGRHSWQNWRRGELLLPMEMIPGADADD